MNVQDENPGPNAGEAPVGQTNGPPPVDDPLFPNTWHLDNTGQSFGPIVGTPGFDMRVLDAWAAGYTGEGVTVAVSDDGVEGDHPDLAANFDFDAGIDLPNDRVGGAHVEADEGHGTSVAGVIAAVADNGLGTVGVAYDATLISTRHGQNDAEDLQPNAEEEQLIAAFDFQRENGVDVSNNSWGPNVPDTADPDIQAAIERFATEGRDGLGGVVTFAAGNERAQTLSANLEGDENSPYAIPVAAVDQTGKFSVFSSPGANVLVSAPGENIITTARQGTGPAPENPDYTLEAGTSFASPATAAVAALILEANPDLTARDVQEIVAVSARKTDDMTSYLTSVDAAKEARTDDEYAANGIGDANGGNLDAELAKLVTPWDWTTNGADDWNGGGLHVSHDYGFGMIDATAATRLARTWEPSASPAWETLEARGSGNVEGGIHVAFDPGHDFTVAKASLSLDITGGDDLDEGQLTPEEQEDAALKLIQSFDVSLTSPSGTISHLVSGFDAEQFETVNQRFAENAQGGDDSGDGDDNGDGDDSGDDMSGDEPDDGDDDDAPFLLTTVQSWGEDAAGTWTIEAVDKATGAPLGLNQWSLDLYGDTDNGDDTYVYTDAYAGLKGEEPGRGLLSDDDGGVNTINAAMLTSDSVLNLNAGATSRIAGADLRIDPATTITNAYGGVGSDEVKGNGADNEIKGFNGRDALAGGDGDDVLDGGGRDDTIKGARGDDTLAGGNGDDVLFGGADRDVFKFFGTTPGHDVIADFKPGLDKLSFDGVAASDGTALRGFDQLENDIVLGKDGLTLNFGGGSLTLPSVDRLVADDVMFA